MGKIGIITHYYNSKNYGGVLQAYALCRFLKDQGYNVEQIQFDKEKGKGLKHKIGDAYRYFLSIPLRIRYKRVYAELSAREEKFAEFRYKQIPHSEVVFTKKTLKKLAKEYSMFITGSDQVWHPDAVCDAYLLDFGVEDIKKMSYAASIAKDSLTEQELDRYRSALADYCAISVREKNAIKLLQPISPVGVKWVVDPVFLLKKVEWQSLIEKKSNINSPFIVCYFLGDDKEIRKLAEAYARSKGIKMVTIPFLNGNVCDFDLGFGDEQHINISPIEFIRLIQNADTVFTDSFHAMAFSLLFERQVFVFERSTRSPMGSRIESLAELFEISDHYCNEPGRRTLEYINKIDLIDYSKQFVKFEMMRNESIFFLIENVERCLKEDK